MVTSVNVSLLSTLGQETEGAATAADDAEKDRHQHHRHSDTNDLGQAKQRDKCVSIATIKYGVETINNVWIKVLHCLRQVNIHT